MRAGPLLASIPLVASLLCGTALPGVAHAQMMAPSLLDSFRLGTGGGVLCQAQNSSRDPALKGMFDRAWTVVCRDAARPIAKLYALRTDQPDLMARLADARAKEVDCGAEGQGTVAGLGAVAVTRCRLKTAEVDYTAYSYREGRTLYVAEGLAGYDSALALGLRTIVEDRIADGMVTVATTSVANPAAFARVQAGTLDPDQALAEGYRRNASGDYAEAAEFFATLQQRAGQDDAQRERSGEYLINQALQKSNLGEFAEADRLFAEAERIPTSDRVESRLRRNFMALHLLNQQKLPEALAVLDKPMAQMDDPIPVRGSAIEIGADVAAEINSGLPVAQRLGATESTALTPVERAAILDAQAGQLRGTIWRLQGRPAEARTALEQALTDAVAVREGRIVSITRLRAQILAEIALSEEAGGNVAGGEARLREALTLLQTQYPETSAVNGARARLAAYLARHAQADAAMALYAEVIRSASSNGGSITGIANQIAPYYALLVERMPANPALADDFFLASQVFVRPGVADTQAVLARELSEGGSEAARLFRQSVTLSRDIERNRIELAQAAMRTEQEGAAPVDVDAIRTSLIQLEAQQAATQALLGNYPQFRAVAASTLTLADLRATLKPGEAYMKLLTVGGALYAFYNSPTLTTAYRLPISSAELDTKVDSIRETIASEVNGQLLTYPFDMDSARSLFVSLMGPVSADLANVTHLVFEPDGGMLRLPVNLLVEDDASVQRVAARTAQPGADPFDVSGVSWLGRNRSVSTAVSARAFRDTRMVRQSAATRQYIGFGQNAPVSGTVQLAATRSMSGAGSTGCDWPLAAWDRPISAAELRTASNALGDASSAIVTGAQFTDTDVTSRGDLNTYRILHFATHGFVTAPRIGCPARPALLTSFGPAGSSDGLLSFGEIFDLKIDADLVILSACNTAGTASIAATREAGVTTGGGTAMDGLVRAFIGAGGRSVLASHWPAPDDFDATQKLMSSLFEDGRGESIGQAVRGASIKLMNDPLTSHPYYWAGFALVGDGAQPLLAAR
ncbi:CHAT domain-containing tetratricopeptide repeat protein [Sphingomonas sanxanigenens]|uniref:CHAT domain-containing tetratricopeptide repeat protein n=1 Tax=Sphingomonas sanxanigenens TaxID=397260 RepID=UPI0004B4559D|nr:CHAT domain-containing protein [Sphingomonas sanxanigenens]